MRWFRPRSRLTAIVAAAALLLQLALTSAHVHIANGDGHDAASHAAIANAVKSAAPAQHDDDHDRADGLCLVCANIHLAGLGQLPDAPALDAPTLSEAGVRVPVPQDGNAPHVSLAFRSRAPPLA